METSERADQFRQSPNTNNPSSFVDVINILVVDDDSTTLAIVSAMLKTWSYQVVSVRNPIDALITLRAKKGLFDLVVTDLHMPQMNGFELQKHIHEEFKLPVIMMSADDKESVIMKSLEGGVVYYIVKPVSKDDIKNVWQYAVAAKKGKSVAIEEIESAPREAPGEVEDGRNSAISSNGDEQDKEKQAEAAKNKKARKRPREDDDEELMVAPKKAKVVWTNSLHNQFLLAIRHIGLDKAVPKRILEFMNVPGLTRENVASHLQKYRLFLKRVADKARLSKCLSERVFRSSFAYGHPSFMFNNVGRDQLHQQLMKQQQMGTSSIGSTFQPSLGGINGIGNGNTLALTTSASNNLGSSIQFPNQHQASSSRSNMPHQLIGSGQSRLLNNNQINILRGQQPMLLGNNGNNLQLSQPNYGRPAAIGMQQPMMNNLGNGGMSYSLMNNIGTNITGLTTNNIGTNNLMQIYPQQNQARQQAGLITNSPFCYNLATSGIQNGTNFTPMSPSIENMAAGTSFNNVNQLSLSGNFSRTTPLMNNINAGSGLLSNGYFNNEIINGLTNGVRNVNLSGASIGNVNSGYMVQFGAGSNSSMSSAGFETSNIASAGQFPPVCNQTNINIDQQQNVFSELTPPAENNIEQYGGGLSNLAGGGNIIDNSYSLMNNTNTAPTLINNNNTSQEQEFVNENDDEDMMMLRNLFMEQHNNVYQPPPYDQQQGGEDHQLPPDFTFLYQTEMPNSTGNQQVMDPTANQAVDTPANQIVDSPANQVSNQDFYHVEESSNQLQGGGDQQALNCEFSNNVFESEDFNMFGQNYPFQDFDDESINSILGPGL